MRLPIIRRIGKGRVLMYGKCAVKRLIQIDEIYTVSEQNLERGYFFEGEAHDFWEFVAIINGTPGITADTELMSMSPGQIVFHKPMEFHNIWSDKNKGMQIIIISFSGTVVPDLSGKIFSMSPDDIAELKSIFKAAQECFILNGVNCIGLKDGMENRAQAFVNRVELFILSVISSGDINRNTPKTLSAQNYTNIIHTLERNVNKQLTIDDIAHLCNMSRANLKKTFCKYAGTGIMHYFNNMKMLKAAELLSGGMSVKETAISLGFADQNYFSASFKRIMGKPPSYFH